jgi:FlaA1/EpsC-like NDP-sugar epimerase
MRGLLWRIVKERYIKVNQCPKKTSVFTYSLLQTLNKKMSPLDNPALPKGSLVLVTGVNGLLGSHVAKQFLEFGYKVRGTVRSPEKNSWLTAAFDNEYGQGNFELVKLADMTDEDAMKEVAKGQSLGFTYTMARN